MSPPVFRPAELGDIPAMMQIRNNVREKALVNRVIGHSDYVRAMTVDGRAWVAEVGGTDPAYGSEVHHADFLGA